MYSLASILERILLADAHILLASCCLFIKSILKIAYSMCEYHKQRCK